MSTSTWECAPQPYSTCTTWPSAGAISFAQTPNAAPNAPATRV
jgi:hypothetical protein